MTGRIVVGIDGSHHSGNALEWAVDRARLGGQTLELVNVYSLPTNVDFYGYHGMASATPVQWLAEASQELLDKAVARVAELAPELPVTSTSRMGSASQTLAAASEDADLVVVGRRGLGAATSALLGSVSNRLAVEARSPLVVVGEGELPTAGPIVVGVDGSDFSSAALRFAVTEAAARKTSVRAVTAFHLQPGLAVAAYPELLARMRAEVEAEVEDVTSQALKALGDTMDPSVSVAQVTVESRPADAIVAHAADAQLIVVGSHGKGFVRRMLLGSVSRQVLHDADRPVAIVDVSES